MRATLFGKQVRVQGDKFLGINLGYNFYTEHEYGIEKIPSEINSYSIALGNMSMLYRPNISQAMLLRRKVSAQNKAIKAWDDTPFKGFILYPCTIYTRREIIIDNTSIQNKYNRFLTSNGNYTLLYIGMAPEHWRVRNGERRKFTEEELLYMQDYNVDMSINPGFMMNGRNKTMNDNTGFAAAWQGRSHDIMLLVSSELESDKHIVDGIISAIKKGSLTIVGNEQRLFSDRGLILLDLDNCYKVIKQ